MSNVPTTHHAHVPPRCVAAFGDDQGLHTIPGADVLVVAAEEGLNLGRRDHLPAKKQVFELALRYPVGSDGHCGQAEDDHGHEGQQEFGCQ